jgi:hypothetical protein
MENINKKVRVGVTQDKSHLMVLGTRQLTFKFYEDLKNVCSFIDS